tara:strand:- start:401 stop:1402 length:1002 start_codon:yes stop_codon:yes gene_type:complete
MLVFAVESSCDETSVCIMNEYKQIFSHIIYSQEIHEKYGGVVPELASRAHLEILQQITKKAFKNTGLDPKDIDIYAATCGPGLIGGLLVGSTFAKSLAIGARKPFMPINHLEAHILSTSFNNEVKLPHLALLLTGGHTQIYLLKNNKNILLLGETIDDALGEAFDKIAKILGLQYPGGSQIEKCAKKGDEKFFNLPQPMLNDDSFNFSFSGIKTAVNLIVKKNKLDANFINNISASFQNCVVNILKTKLRRALIKLKKQGTVIKSFSLVGGVANNNYIRIKLSELKNDHKVDMLIPSNEMISDNAAMIAWACIKKYDGKNMNINFKPNPRLKI